MLRTSIVIFVSLLLAPLVAIAWCAACLRRPSLGLGLGERLGRLPSVSPGGVWFHGASAGEAKALVSLLRECEARGMHGFATTVTPSGREVLRREAVANTIAYAPFDIPLCVARVLSRARPRAFVSVETELWPSLILTAKSSGVPVLIASGRISDRSFVRYQRFRWLVAPVMRRVDGVAARSPEDANRFKALGVPSERVIVAGDLKMDSGSVASHLATDLVRATSAVSIFVAGSTHPGEERAALDALSACERRGCEVALVIAPRHLERLPEIERELAASGRRVERRSQLGSRVLANGDVLILDTTGELAALYAAASMAFVGGTLANVGGHNLLEPLIEGCPVAYGPRIETVRESAAIARESGAGIEVADAAGLCDAIANFAADAKQWRARGESAKQFLATRRGSAARIASWIEEHVGEAVP
jgi:3-deoxy-D-manno-octulosonic-acid transferase